MFPCSFFICFFVFFPHLIPPPSLCLLRSQLTKGCVTAAGRLCRGCQFKVTTELRYWGGRTYRHALDTFPFIVPLLNRLLCKRADIGLTPWSEPSCRISSQPVTSCLSGVVERCVCVTTPYIENIYFTQYQPLGNVAISWKQKENGRFLISRFFDACNTCCNACSRADPRYMRACDHFWIKGFY